MPILTDNERLGTLVGTDYAIESILGRGGMGTIFSAKHLRTGRSVAVKVLHPQFVRDPVAVRRFLNEARAVASIRHPNVVEVLDVDQFDDSTVFMVLAKLDGESLGDRLDRDRVLSPATVVEFLLPVMRALAVAHSRGVVHRDIKPDNIFLATDDSGALVPTLLDFGIAKTMDPSESSLQTMTGTMIGTPQYMAPEQATDSKQADHLVDIYALGVVWFECLAGQRPIDGASPAVIIGKLLSTQPPKLRSVAEWVPAELAEVVDQAIAFERTVRIQSMDEFIEKITHAVEILGLVVAPLKVGPDALPKLDVTAKIAAVRLSVETLQETDFAAVRQARSPASLPPTASQSVDTLGPNRGSEPIVARTSLAGLIVALGVAAAVGVAATFVRPNQPHSTASSVAQSSPSTNPVSPAINQASVRRSPPPTVLAGAVESPSSPMAEYHVNAAQSTDAGWAISSHQLTIGVIRRSNAGRNINSVVQHPSNQTTVAVEPSSLSATVRPQGAAVNTPVGVAVNRPPAVASEW